MAEKREAEKQEKLKEIENKTQTTLQKLKEDYQTVLKVQSSFSYVAIILIISFIILIISPDFCRFGSYLKRSNKVHVISEKKQNQQEENKNYKNLIINKDRRVKNFALKKQLNRIYVIKE